MTISRLDHLPVELFHHVFSYLSAHEIFYAFTYVTSYIHAVLQTYRHYRVNFKAISRNQFDLVCQHIIPDHVIALTLSDDKDTPDSIKLFQSRFQIHQFTRLQALEIIEIGPDFCPNFAAQMVTLKHLRSFRCSRSNRIYPWILYASLYRGIEQDLFDTYTPIIPQLSQLKLDHGDFLGSIQFPHLRHLVLERSSIDLIKHIASAAPQLHTLHTSFSFDSFSSELFSPMPQLNRLILRIFGKHFCD